jgi:hypothetical protein
MNPDELKQSDADEMVSMNAKDLDAEQLDQIEQELEDVSGGGCGNNSCWIFSQESVDAPDV